MENDQLLKIPMQAFVNMWEIILNFLRIFILLHKPDPK